MDVSKIAKRMKIVTWELSRWGAGGKHKEETAEVNRRHGTDEAAVVHVTQCDSPLLKQISELHGAWRAWNEEMTRPTIQKAMRLLPLTKEIEHAAKTSDFHQKHDDLVNQFLGVYPSLRDEAPGKLGQLYDARRWPVYIAERFGFKVRYMCCPTEGDWADWLKASAHAAVDSIRSDLQEATLRVAERCAADGALYATVFTNVKDILDSIEDFDTDGLLADIAAKVKPLAQIDAEDLRKNKGMRAKVASQARDISSIFGAGSLEKLAS